jgi:hypothetical protein
MDEAHLDLPALGDALRGGVAVGAWLRPASISEGEAHVVGDGGGGVASFQVVLDGGYPVFRLSSETTGTWTEILRATTPLEPNVWQYLQLAYDGSSSRFFLDGAEIGSGDIIYAVPGSYNPIAVGAVVDVMSQTFSYHHQYLGDLDELVLFGR